MRSPATLGQWIKCREGELALPVHNDALFAAICAAIGRLYLASNPKFAKAEKSQQSSCARTGQNSWQDLFSQDRRAVAG